ncbi:uncharacterized protein KY384_000714 [Bacidia gigantensis]|uniref:uncharacterized protein n=1 Tax=Bacidia gigantensis TaxID=2732470 RepID=UPI001D047F5D|nr:uncharacterized protein KY384_000714 [Bacidia gigantensis]KAG8525952.1 hypothetical protein KY384_000714 [Bacidia gigantensis]
MSGSSKDEGAGVAPQNKASWGSFLKALASYNGDIASLTAPPFILGTTSLTEFSAYWTEHPSIFVAPATEQDPEKRALLVLKWFLTTLKQSYSSRSDKYGTEKKPLNPFLGELFLGKWDDEAGTTHLLQGYNGQKVSFSRTIIIKQIGHALLTLSAFNETYLFTLPSLHIEGLIYGKPFVELDGCSYITSSTGYIAKIDYSGKGWLSGKKNTFTATLAKQGHEKDVLYTVDGQWTDSFSIKSGGGGGSHLKKMAGGSQTLETYNAKASKTTSLSVPPIDTQDPYESHKAWRSIKAAIEKGDMDTVHVEKSALENAQRELRKKEQAEGRSYTRRFFNKSDKSDIFDSLAKPIYASIEADRTGGVWRFDESKKADRQNVADGVKGADMGVVNDTEPPSEAPTKAELK